MEEAFVKLREGRVRAPPEASDGGGGDGDGGGGGGGDGGSGGKRRSARSLSALNIKVPRTGTRAPEAQTG